MNFSICLVWVIFRWDIFDGEEKLPSGWDDILTILYDDLLSRNNITSLERGEVYWNGGTRHNVPPNPKTKRMTWEMCWYCDTNDFLSVIVKSPCRTLECQFIRVVSSTILFVKKLWIIIFHCSYSSQWLSEWILNSILNFVKILSYFYRRLTW